MPLRGGISLRPIYPIGNKRTGKTLSDHIFDRIKDPNFLAISTFVAIGIFLSLFFQAIGWLADEMIFALMF